MAAVPIPHRRGRGAIYQRDYSGGTRGGTEAAKPFETPAISGFMALIVVGSGATITPDLVSVFSHDAWDRLTDSEG